MILLPTAQGPGAHAAIGLALSVLLLGACAADAPPPLAAAATASPVKDADALVYELEVAGTGAEVLRESFEKTARDARTLVRGPGEGRRLELRLVADEPKETASGLVQTVRLIGVLPGGCQVLTFAPTLTKPGGRTASEADRAELLRLGAEAVAARLAEVAPKIGPDATCIATGR